jgi:hypothetical protein
MYTTILCQAVVFNRPKCAITFPTNVNSLPQERHGSQLSGAKNERFYHILDQILVQGMY